MGALGAAGFPVPCVQVLCSDPSIMGSAFYFMNFAVANSDIPV
jgi:aminoglycoside phosphotransferase (APT) family kinase protein